MRILGHVWLLTHSISFNMRYAIDVCGVFIIFSIEVVYLSLIASVFVLIYFLMIVRNRIVINLCWLNSFLSICLLFCCFNIISLLLRLSKIYTKRSERFRCILYVSYALSLAFVSVIRSFESSFHEERCNTCAFVANIYDVRDTIGHMHDGVVMLHLFVSRMLIGSAKTCQRSKTAKRTTIVIHSLAADSKQISVWFLGIRSNFIVAHINSFLFFVVSLIINYRVFSFLVTVFCFCWWVSFSISLFVNDTFEHCWKLSCC